MSSPTFVARFADGVVTRMTCFCELPALDLARGIKLSNFAYELRTGKPPTAIVSASFVRPFTDETIASYDDSEALNPSAQQVS